MFRFQDCLQCQCLWGFVSVGVGKIQYLSSAWRFHLLELRCSVIRKFLLKSLQFVQCKEIDSPCEWWMMHFWLEPYVAGDGKGQRWCRGSKGVEKYKTYCSFSLLALRAPLQVQISGYVKGHRVMYPLVRAVCFTKISRSGWSPPVVIQH